MRNHFFSSDFHCGHGNIMKYSRRLQWLNKEERDRLESGDQNFKVSWESVIAMNNGIIDNINKIVGPDDVLWHLGDFCFAPRDSYVNSAWSYRKQIKCKNVFCCYGNHDRNELAEVFPNISDLIQLTIGENGEYWTGEDAYHKVGFKLFLFHYACAVWNGSHKGVCHLYGHSHASAESNLDKAMPGHKSFDCGIDNALNLLGEYRPFTLDEIKGFMSKRPGWQMDHHRKLRSFTGG